MSRSSLRLFVFVWTLCLLSPALLAADMFRFQHENVLGTSCEITVWSTNQNDAAAVEAIVLAEIDRLQKIFSTYDSTSELMRWQRDELSAEQLSADLIQVLERAEYWRKVSDGAFDVRCGALAQLWQQAAKTNCAPSASELQTVCGQLKNAPYHIKDNTITRCDSLAITLDALAKGFILDAACEAVGRTHADLLSGRAGQGLSVMIGGDLRSIGRAEQQVSIANPFDAGENSKAVAAVSLHGSTGLATSGGYRRYVEIEGVKHSHILDPRTGWSASALAAVTVIAPCGMDADAAATTLNVLGPSAGLQLIESLDGYAALMVLNSGETITSSRWNQYQTTGALHRPLYVNITVAPEDKDKTGLFVKFTLGSTGGGRYHRPYVAVWLEDKDGFPVKTGVLWLQTTGPGPRWHRDLTKWYGNDQMRKLVEEKELIGTISGATRGPGEYETRFDGTDNAGKPLKPGKYALCLEAAREHGTHQYVRETIEWGSKDIAKKELKSGTEFGAISYRFVAP